MLFGQYEATSLCVLARNLSKDRIYYIENMLLHLTYTWFIQTVHALEIMAPLEYIQHTRTTCIILWVGLRVTIQFHQ